MDSIYERERTSREKETVLQRALPFLFALLKNPKFNEGEGKKLEAIRHGLVFEVIAKEEFKSLRNPSKPLRRLEKLIISSMKSDIGFLRPPGPSEEKLYRPDILVMEYDKQNQIVTITQVGEIKLGLWGLSPKRLEKVWKQRKRIIPSLKQFLDEAALLKESGNIEKLIGSPVRQINLLSQEKGLKFFYVLPHGRRIPPSIKGKWEIRYSCFSYQDIKRTTQTLLRTAAL